MIAGLLFLAAVCVVSVVYAFVVPVGLSLIGAAFHGHFVRDVCPRCGFDLRGTRSGRCNECGWAIRSVDTGFTASRPRSALCGLAMVTSPAWSLAAIWGLLKWLVT